MFDRWVGCSSLGVRRSLVLAALVAAVRVGGASAAPVVGFVEEWPDTSRQGWGSFSGLMNYSNPGTGGSQGAGDGFLIMSNTHLVAGGSFGAFSGGSEYAGDWVAAGINSVRVWLNDVGAADPLEIHFVIGKAQINVWQYNEGFQPPHDAWAEFVVDLTSPAKFTQIFGPGTFQAALQDVDRVHFRHDLAPYLQNPDIIKADVGIDHLVLSGENVPVISTTWGRLKALYR